jgi:signal transduction histidine kinase
MTSIRAFSEILMEGDGMSGEEQRHFAQIIHDESIRLTRLLDDLLDLSVLEHGQVQLNIAPVMLRDLIDKSITASNSVQAAAEIHLSAQPRPRGDRNCHRCRADDAGFHQYPVECAEILHLG